MSKGLVAAAVTGFVTAVSMDITLLVATDLHWRIACTIGAVAGFAVSALIARAVTGRNY